MFSLVSQICKPRRAHRQRAARPPAGSIRFRIAGAVALVLAGASILSGQTPGNPSEETVLSPGDMVRLEVWRQPEFSGEFSIAADGSIRHPLYRDVRVTGVPMRTAEERLRTFLRQFEANPQFVMTPLLSVAVGGEVRQPGLYNLLPEITIAQAIARAGGPTERGRLDRVRVLRGGRELTLDLTRPEAEFSQVSIQSEDQILVERRRNIWRDYIAPVAAVTGAVASVVNVILRNR